MPRQPNIKARVNGRFDELAQRDRSLLQNLERRFEQPQLSPPLLNIFQRSRLDPRNDLHWRIIAFVLADEIYPIPGKPGARLKWNRGRLRELFEDFDDRRKTNPGLRNKAIVGQMMASGRYNEVKNDETLRRLLARAAMSMAQEVRAGPSTRHPYEASIRRILAEL